MTVSETMLTGALLDPAQPAPEGLTDGQGRPAGRRLDVYRNNIASSLTEALERNFPAIARLIGAENFRRIAGLFLRAHPPQSPLIALYGADFACFLDAFPPLGKYPYLGDIARLEQARREAYHAADTTPLDPATLAALSPEALTAARMRLAPALRLVRSHYPIHAIWAFNMEGGPKPGPQAQAVLVTRPGFDPVLTPLSPAAGAAIAALLAGETLGTAHDRGQALESGFDLAEALTPLVTQQAVTALTT